METGINHKGTSRVFLHVICLLIIQAALQHPLNADVSDSSGIVYLVIAIDTEPARPDPRSYKQSLDFSCFDKTSDLARVEEVMDTTWRHQYHDSFGNTLRFTWFIMTHEVFCHAVDGGYPVVYDAMMDYKNLIREYGDEIAWHYHHADWTDPDGDGSSAWNQLTTFDETSYTHGTDIDIAERHLNDLLAERDFFPTAFRSGWTWENNDFSQWLESIIPFDFSANPPNQGERETHQPIRNHYDWSRAPRTYAGYHPDYQDYQKPGHMRRWIFRTISPNIRREWQRIFRAATEDGSQILCYTGHTYDRLRQEIGEFLPELQHLGDSLGVRLVFATASEAGAAISGRVGLPAPELKFTKNGDTLIIQSDVPIFQRIPYCVITDSSGNHRRIHLGSDKRQQWWFDISNLGEFRVVCTACNYAGDRTIAEYHR